jgi:hypothetical protein
VKTSPVPGFIDLVFTKTSPKRWFSITENERFGLVFVKTGSINSGTRRSYSVIENERIEVVFAKTGSIISSTSFHENKPKTLVFSHTKRAFWACFRENWVYNFGTVYACVYVLASIYVSVYQNQTFYYFQVKMKNAKLN